MYVPVWICIHLVSECVPTRRLPSTSSSLDQDYLACLAWLVLWPSWCDTEWPPSLLRPASSRAQPVPRGQTTWSSALIGLDGPSDITTRLSLFGGTAGAVVTQAHTFTHSIFHSLTSRREAKLCTVTGLNTIQSETVDQTLPPRWDGEGRRLYFVLWTCFVAPGIFVLAFVPVNMQSRCYNIVAGLVLRWYISPSVLMMYITVHDGLINFYALADSRLCRQQPQDSIQVPDVGGYHKPRPRTSSKSPQPVDFPNLKS